MREHFALRRRNAIDLLSHALLTRTDRAFLGTARNGARDGIEQVLGVISAWTPTEKMDPESKEWGRSAENSSPAKLWAPTVAGPFIAAHLKSLTEYPPSGVPIH